jgi:myo-inositol catabolism protein IolC
MINQLGYNHPLYILAFDHRGTFAKKIYNADMEMLSIPQLEEIKEFKKIIYDGFKDALSKGVPKEDAAILVDEEFGGPLLTDAKLNGFKIIVTVEKTGQDVFSFEYGREFGEHLEKYMPDFSKALIKYNPEDSDEKKRTQAENLKVLSDYSHRHGFKFLLEPLVPPSAQQLSKANGSMDEYDRTIRPDLTVAMMRELQSAGVEPDIWKLEGLEAREDYEKVVAQARSGNRGDVSIVVLGRGATEEKVEEWIRTGASVPGVVGFAVGRTIFWDALVAFHEGKKTREEAVSDISSEFYRLYTVFDEGRKV